MCKKMLTVVIAIATLSQLGGCIVVDDGAGHHHYRSWWGR
jgi:hypothetical protein